MLRLLGVGRDHPKMVKARQTLLKFGMLLLFRWSPDASSTLAQVVLREFLHGASSGSQYSMFMNGKAITLSPLSFGEWSDVPSDVALTRRRLLPDWVPIHPHRWWIHTRNVYIPMSFLYGHRFKAREDPLILSLRKVRALL